MFRNQSGNRCADAELIAERIRLLPDSEIAALQERKNTLREAFSSFDTVLLGLPQKERDATLSLFYKEITDMLFDCQLSLLTRASREKIVRAQTREEKSEALREFQVAVEKLGTLYGV
jgi:hypothetical protein